MDIKKTRERWMIWKKENPSTWEGCLTIFNGKQSDTRDERAVISIYVFMHENLFSVYMSMSTHELRTMKIKLFKSTMSHQSSAPKRTRYAPIDRTVYVSPLHTKEQM